MPVLWDAVTHLSTVARATQQSLATGQTSPLTLQITDIMAAKSEESAEMKSLYTTALEA